MKKIILAAVIAALAACNNLKDSKNSNSDSLSTTESSNAQADPATAPRMEFERETYDFGTITSGEKVKYDFKFKNAGKSPLIISNATASCGCTVPEYPNTPINPGEEGVIKVVFDSSGKSGMQNKVVTITSNAITAVSQLHLVGDVKKAKNN